MKRKQPPQFHERRDEERRDRERHNDFITGVVIFGALVCIVVLAYLWGNHP